MNVASSQGIKGRSLPKADRALQTVVKLQMFRRHSEAAFA